ncbi:MAG: hypothetical protein WC916_01230 [Candidatus Woesearchaeota archaeon]
MKLFDMCFKPYDLRFSNIGQLLERFKMRFSKEYRVEIAQSIATIANRAVSEVTPIHSFKELFRGIPLECKPHDPSLSTGRFIYSGSRQSLNIYENRIAVYDCWPNFVNSDYYQLPFTSFNHVPRKIMEKGLQAYGFKYFYFTKKECNTICDLIYEK